MGVSDLKRQVLAEDSPLRHGVEARDLEGPDPHRLTFLNPKGDVDVLRRPPDQGVDLRLEKPVNPIQQPNPEYVAQEFLLVEPALLPQSQTPDDGDRGKAAGARGGDGRALLEIIECAIAFEAQLADDQFLLGTRWPRTRTHREQDNQAAEKRAANRKLFRHLAPCTASESRH
jgi:hypothetical protein